VLETDKENVPVHLGPAWYVDRQKFEIRPGDRIDVRGSRVSVDGKPAIVAAEIRKGEQKLELRNASGVPLWSGGGRMCGR
jgi:hypothetical protein